jgi:hypothetical protein
MENLILPLALACAVSMALSIASITWVIVYSAPAALRKSVEQSSSIAIDSNTRVDQLEARFVHHKAETSALHESIEGILDSVERKRRQISGAASRLKPEPEPVTRDDIVQLARRKVYGGA